LSLVDAHMPVIREHVKVLSLDCFSISGEGKNVAAYNFDALKNESISSEGDTSQLKLPQKLSRLIECLSWELYERLFCRLASGTSQPTLPSWLERQRFMDQLSAVNACTKSLDSGWQVVHTDTFGMSHAVKNGVKRPLLPGTFILGKGPSNQVSFHRAGESRELAPDYYYVLSDVYFHDNREHLLFYWNIDVKGAPKLLHALTETLNFYKVPFQFKCLNHPELYTRADCAVLTIDRQDGHLVNRLLKPINKDLGAYLRDEIPLFTKDIAHGVGSAINPFKGENYGLSLMNQVAERLCEEFIINFCRATEDRAESTAFSQHRSFITI